MQDATVFNLFWVGSLVVILVCAGLIGRATKYKLVGILIDQRGRYSLNRFQLVMWTWLVLSTFLGLFFNWVFDGGTLDAAFKIDQNLLVLMGISVGSATTAAAAKSSKDLTARVQKAGVLAPHPDAVKAAAATGLAAPVPQAIEPHFAQVFLEEEGSQIDQVVDVSKFQNFFFTVALGITFIVMVANQHKYPNFAEHSDVLWLLGISHAGYVGGKLPKKA